VNRWDLIPALLLTLLSVALVSGAAILLLMAHLRRRQKLFFTSEMLDEVNSINLLTPHTFSHRPNSWVAVKSRNLQSVQNALGLSNPHPCTWIQGLASDQKLFIAPPINGWILVTGCGLPDPLEDVDACFRFLLDLSRKLGHVHFFLANPMLGHHAWARAEAGRIVRAYAWAGQTLWNQGIKTQAETDLGLKCFHYFETSDSTLLTDNDLLSSNAEKVPQLAAQWSIDPAAVDERTLDHACGIAGEPPRLY
jgi:hypothetical protein